MLRFFEKYQKVFYFFVAILMIASFSLFGTFDTLFHQTEKRDDREIGKKLDGSQMMLSEVQFLSRFLTFDDEILHRDFLRTQLYELLATAYFEPLKGDLTARLERAKRFRPYAHPQVPQFNATLVWTRFFPDMLREFQDLREESETTPQTLKHLATLYQQQKYFSPDLLRQCLIIQQKQQGIAPDPALSYEDLSLFGFHSVEDWFGRQFLDLVSEFILNAAVVAEQKGLQASLEEAKGDLLYRFQKLPEKTGSFAQYLQYLGLSEKDACATWRKVLLFRRYLGLSDAIFVDRMAYREFASYALETAIVEQYHWPLAHLLKTPQDWQQFGAYLQAVSAEKSDLPTTFYSLEEIEKKFPQLIQTTYRAQVGEVSKREVLLHASVKEVWDWELNSWETLRKKFSYLPLCSSREERFAALERLSPKLRNEIDWFARNRLLEEHPEWIEKALAARPLQEKTFSKKEFSEDGETFYRVEELEVLHERHLVTFEEAKEQGLLAEMKSSFLEKNREKTLSSYALQAYEVLKEDPLHPRWVKGEGEDPVLGQFKFERAEQEIQRMEKGERMEHVFAMEEMQWSPIDISDEGEISFFYLREKHIPHEPILEQMYFGKEILASDAKRYLAERLIETLQKQKNIVIPTQEGYESL